MSYFRASLNYLTHFNHHQITIFITEVGSQGLVNNRLSVPSQNAWIGPIMD